MGIPAFAPPAPRCSCGVSLAQMSRAKLTNRQIGERMFIATGTAKVHVAHIISELDITTRAQLAVMATERGVNGVDGDA